ncbi:MAG: cupin domain-containing protein, partial [Candidatus Binatia bacterium]
MQEIHDRPSGSLAPASGGERAAKHPPATIPQPAAPAGVDVLSDVLRAVRLTGAVFFRTEATSPWVMELPDGAALAGAIDCAAQHVISYHVVTRGSCWGGLADGPPIRLEAGDVLVLPRGDAYVMSIARAMRGGPPAAEVVEFLREMAAGRLPFTVTEGGGGPDRLDLVCGFLACDLRPFNPLMAALPRLLHVPRAFGSSGDPLDHLIELTLAEARERRAGGDCVRLRLSELLFVEVVRRWLARLPDDEKGWLAALREPTVGRALRLLHERPAERWTLEKLARDAGLSRSALAERFAGIVGRPPMEYL